MTTKIMFMTEDTKVIERANGLKHLLIGFMTSNMNNTAGELERPATEAETEKYDRIMTEFAEVAAAVGSEFDLTPPTDLLDMVSISKAILQWLITA